MTDSPMKHKSGMTLTQTAKEYSMRTDKPKEQPKEGYEWVWNLMTEQWIQQPVDTPWSCRVDSETFWSQ